MTLVKHVNIVLQPQVEVAQIDGNEYFVKVFSEHKPGGFVKLMEALNTLGMDVVHATVTSHKGLVSNVFKVEVIILPQHLSKVCLFLKSE